MMANSASEARVEVDAVRCGGQGESFGAARTSMSVKSPYVGASIDFTRSLREAETMSALMRGLVSW